MTGETETLTGDAGIPPDHDNRDSGETDREEQPLLACRVWGICEDENLPPAGSFVLDDPAREAEDFAGLCVVAPGCDEVRAEALAEAGAERVFVQRLALEAPEAVDALVEKIGADRLGLWMPVAMIPVRWTMDRESNADFTFLGPSLACPTWEILVDGQGTGTHAVWWAEQMQARGIESALVAVYAGDQNDENQCAIVASRFGKGFWLTAQKRGDDAALETYVRYSGARQLVLNEIPEVPEHDEKASDEEQATPDLMAALNEAARLNELDRVRAALMSSTQLKYS